MISIIGGVYWEKCVYPHWDEILGSGGRAAACLSTRCEARLVTAMSEFCRAEFNSVCTAFDFILAAEITDYEVTFKYDSPLVLQDVVSRAPEKTVCLSVEGENVLVFGMLNAEFNVKGNKVVFDPQGGNTPFRKTDSAAAELVYVLNLGELRKLTGEYAISAAARYLLEEEQLSAVVIKLGPVGAGVLVAGETEIRMVPAFRTDTVFKLGSGDVFTASFAFFWQEGGKSIYDAALLASKVTASYVSKNQLVIDSEEQVGKYRLNAVVGAPQPIYLASPFFLVEQLWLVQLIRDFMYDCDVPLFSPIHEIGLGGDDVAVKDLEALEQCGSIFAVLNGNDPGTIFEIGYGIAHSKPVTIYSQRPIDYQLTMFEGSNCRVFSDLTAAIYNAVWASFA